MDVLDNEGGTPLHGAPYCVKLLLEVVVSSNTQNEEGDTSYSAGICNYQ